MDPSTRAGGGAFRALGGYNYRIWASGALLFNVGTWMQRTAQDWLVFTQLTQRNATAVGVLVALQFGPMVVLLPVTGYAADRFDRRRLVFITQAIMAALALVLGIVTLAGLVQLWHVHLFALLFGCANAFDVPARQALVSELVVEADLSSAVALNSTSFNAARLVGPAIAGLVIARLGTAWGFLFNAASSVAVMIALSLQRSAQLHTRPRALRGLRGLIDGFHYVWRRAELRVVFFMLLFVGAFALNLSIFVSTMSVRVFGGGPERYGLLTSMMAMGSLVGALSSARLTAPSTGFLIGCAGAFGLALGLSAIMPSYWLCAGALVLVGLGAQLFTTSTLTAVQLSTDPGMRGRVVAIQFAVIQGSSLFGAPIVGRVADTFGPRWSVAFGAAAAVLAALGGALSLAWVRGRDGAGPPPRG